MTFTYFLISIKRNSWLFSLFFSILFKGLMFWYNVFRMSDQNGISLNWSISKVATSIYDWSYVHIYEFNKTNIVLALRWTGDMSSVYPAFWVIHQFLNKYIFVCFWWFNSLKVRVMFWFSVVQSNVHPSKVYNLVLQAGVYIGLDFKYKSTPRLTNQNKGKFLNISLVLFNSFLWKDRKGGKLFKSEIDIGMKMY